MTATENLLFGERAETQPQTNGHLSSWRETFAHSRTEWFVVATDDGLRQTDHVNNVLYTTREPWEDLA